jgi:replicative DNA helicase
MAEFYDESPEACLMAEQALLGSILIDSTYGNCEAIRYAKRTLTPSDFRDGQYRPDGRHARIFTAMCQCERPEQISVATQMNKMGLLKGGDCQYICELVADTPTHLDYKLYADAVLHFANKRNPNRKQKVVRLGVEI